jgi:uncharacterized protein Yka (UPF0111/DUF47 family)
MSIMTRLPGVLDRDELSSFYEIWNTTIDRIEELKAALRVASPSCPDDALRMMKLATECINLLLAAVVSERERCIVVCESWIGEVQEDEINHISAREYAVVAIENIIAEIREGCDLSPALDKDASP